MSISYRKLALFGLISSEMLLEPSFQKRVEKVVNDMATKERKVSIGRRQQTASPSPKDLRSTPEQTVKNDATVDSQKVAPQKTKTITKTALVRKLTKGQKKKNQKKKLSIKLTSKAARKAKQKITKSLINTAKVLEAKKLLKNGKVVQKKEEEEFDSHILEPIFPEETELDKKPKNKRIVRNPVARKVKTEVEDPEICSDSSTNSVKYSRKSKNSIKNDEIDTIKETIEGVISGFTLRPEEIKKEPDYLSESSRSDIIKPKRLTKKQKLSLLQKEIKKENIENAFTIIGQSDQKIIDMLDLNVLKVKKTYPTQKRRHTIEKFPMDSDYPGIEDFPPLIPFSGIPQSPKNKRKPRSCVETKVLNPYTIRPPARMLRNGKQRRMKEHLLEGLDDRRKKRRLCSEVVGSEVSKLSGYDSDSSFSDLVPLSGAEIDLKSVEVKKEQIENHTNLTLSANIRKSLSVENQSYCTDSNSNLCDDPSVQENKNIENLKQVTMLNEDLYPNPSAKVPEKLLILDIMKQNFNEKVDLINENNAPKVQQTQNKLSPIVVEEKESGQKKMSDIISKIVETMGSEEFTATINTTEEGPAVVMQNGDIRENILWENQKDTVKEVSSPPEQQPVEEQLNENIPDEVMPLNDQITENVSVIENDVVMEDKAITEEDKEPLEQKLTPEASETLAEPEVPPVVSANIPFEAVAGPSSAKEYSPPTFEAVAGPSSAKEYSPPALEPDCCLPSTLKVLEQVSEEEAAIKESILNALGLQSLKAAEEARLREKEKPAGATKPEYTGTLKTVIKLNRDSKKKGKNHPLKMTLQKNKGKNGEGTSGTQDDYKIMKEGSTSWKNSGQSSDSADVSSEHTTDGEAANPEGPAKALVIPEKASSFSIHPERLCKDECSFCYGKFGLFDTPCHIASIKTIERQEKILAIEKNLTKDSCLCDACYRHIDRRANTPSYTSKSVKRGPMIAPGPKKNHCHVLGCKNVSANILRRKWIIKMRQQVMQTVNIDLNNLGLHSIPICNEHYSALEHLMICSMCKRRLAKNHIHYLGPEVDDLNNAMEEERIPLKLSEKPVVCKLCRCFATVILKNPEDRPENSMHFFEEYKKRLLHFNNIVPMDKAAAEEPIIVPTKERTDKEPYKKKRKLSKNLVEGDSKPGSPTVEATNASHSRSEQNGSANSGSESPSDYLVDYQSLIPSIAMECSDTETDKDKTRRVITLESLKKSVEVTAKSPSSELAVQRLGSNPYLSVRQLFPGEEELGLQGQIEFNNVKERTTEGWEKCNMSIQYDKPTKQLWQELQKPYGNPSSFLRHLVLLEKYFRNGDLQLKPNASRQSSSYSESVQNRLRAYDNIPTGASRSISIVELNSPTKKSSSGSPSNKETLIPTVLPGLPIMSTPSVTVTSVRPPPVTITQLNNSLLPITITKTKPPPPPGLISLLPGTNRPIAPLTKQPQSQKIKFPITKNWRPGLIPIDPTKPPEKKTGLVQVISGGKPFHITLEDYKKMCAIKRSFEMKQKQMAEAKKPQSPTVPAGTTLVKSNNKSLVITKGPISKVEPKIEQEPPESILDKLDQQVESLESTFNEGTTLLNMPRIPKSLTVIPQTVRKPSRPASPVLVITPKGKS
ncbi:uncharacterized protein LOC123684682 isoform X2 [Harmonia axyridis]|uniref:uncharacterized protein LOC123684682 isoform X2 n=1 Tax=Harmonia axyridis TaxID=115357 RepID=UPI001E2761E8|nr:uncharacterized protein LOC123684682 isoform X2 [Harmonia axyridis]